MGNKSTLKTFDVPASTIQSIIRKFKSYYTVENLIGPGRKRKLLTRCTRINIARLIEKIHRITTKVVLQHFNDSGTHVSRQTLQRTLHENELKGCRPRGSPLITQKHIKSRIYYTTDYQKFSYYNK